VLKIGTLGCEIAQTYINDACADRVVEENRGEGDGGAKEGVWWHSFPASVGMRSKKKGDKFLGGATGIFY